MDDCSRDKRGKIGCGCTGGNANLDKFRFGLVKKKALRNKRYRCRIRSGFKRTMRPFSGDFVWQLGVTQHC